MDADYTNAKHIMVLGELQAPILEPLAEPLYLSRRRLRRGRAAATASRSCSPGPSCRRPTTRWAEYGTCVRDDRAIAPLDTVLAPFIASHYPNLHPLVGSVEIGHMPDSGYWCAHGKTAAVSWADMQSLQATYGWRFISAGRTRVRDWTKLTPAQISAETCGSRDPILSHGLPGAGGQYNWPDNRMT